MEEKKQPLVVLVGPTAVGKTALSIHLAKTFGAEIISGDSMQVYRGMDIGTAKITPAETEGVPHHMIDILSPSESFNALIFKERAETAIADIAKRGRLPMVVGGTGLYVNGLIYNYGFRGERDEAYRVRIFDEMVHDPQKANMYYEKLMALRPDLQGVIFENDYFRISRALEVAHTEGKDVVKDFDMPRNYTSPYNLCLIGLTMNRAVLYERINARVDMMIENGLVEEVEMLLKQGYNKETQALKAIGYKEIIAYLDGQLSLDEAVALLKKNTRHFAKRQLTWFRRDPNLTWFEVDQFDAATLLAATTKHIRTTLNQ
ncbi:MAG: tRNA (adenosine(37)-N6)-dimethylallyltransferase MiaA [Peptococcaceae bacterium]|nr:tRNA (adenosine(37)-N6)-dimethylallyltransferase MiaA [Peptococcaceae bacterium]